MIIIFHIRSVPVEEKKLQYFFAIDKMSKEEVHKIMSFVENIEVSNDNEKKVIEYKNNVFTEKDVVRHRLVQDIIKAYEKQEMRQKK